MGTSAANVVVNNTPRGIILLPEGVEIVVMMNLRLPIPYFTISSLIC